MILQRINLNEEGSSMEKDEISRLLVRINNLETENNLRRGDGDDSNLQRNREEESINRFY